MADGGAVLTSPVGRTTSSTSLALLVVDDERRCLEANFAASRLLGVSRGRLLGRVLDDLLTEDMSERLENVWQAFRESGGHAGPFELALPESRVPLVDISVTSGILPGRHLLILLPAGPRTWPDNTGSADSTDSTDSTDSAGAGSGDLRPPSRRELEVLEHLAGGATDGQIARRLELSPATVQTHVRNAKAKLGARTRAQAVALALRDGLIALG